MKKVLILVGIIMLGVIVFFFIEGPPEQESGSASDKFIVANPVDLNQIASISRFRSCVGHDYSGKNIEGEKESLRSMKHYLAPTAQFDQSTGKVKVLAPFNGKISDIEDENNPRGNQVWLKGPSTGSWNFILFHIDLLPGLDKGSEVVAGQLIGYAALSDGANFDYAVKSFGFGGQTIDSPFNHMAPEVLGEYKSSGITPENIILSKDFRDSNPCPIEPGTESKNDTFFTSGDRTEDWIKLSN